MKEIAIKLPTFILAKAASADCECSKRPLETTYKSGIVFWKKAVGEELAEGDLICEVEIDKKIFEVLSEQAGTLSKQVIAEGEHFSAQDTLGYIAT